MNEFPGNDIEPEKPPEPENFKPDEPEKNFSEPTDPGKKGYQQGVENEIW